MQGVPGPPRQDAGVDDQTREDEARATCQLLRGEVGKRIVHLVCLQAAKLELALRKANIPSKGMVTSLGGI